MTISEAFPKGSYAELPDGKNGRVEAHTEKFGGRALVVGEGQTFKVWRNANDLPAHR